MRAKSAIAAMTAAVAFAGPAIPALAAPCPAAGLISYLAPNFSCTVNDKTISGITANDFDAATTNVTPVTDANNPGLKVTTSIAFHGAELSYTIAAPSTDPITGASLAITASLPPGAFVQVTESLSNGKSLSTSNSTLSDSTTFSAATSLGVTNDILSVEGAVLTSFTNQFSETPITGVPEPASLTLLTLGLGGLGVMLRARRA